MAFALNTASNTINGAQLDAVTAGVQVGAATTSTVGFYGTTPIAQRALAAQATSLVGTASSADVTTDLKAAVIEIMNTLKTIGIWKGSA